MGNHLVLLPYEKSGRQGSVPAKSAIPDCIGLPPSLNRQMRSVIKRSLWADFPGGQTGCRLETGSFALILS